MDSLGANVSVRSSSFLIDRTRLMILFMSYEAPLLRDAFSSLTQNIIPAGLFEPQIGA